MKKKRLKLDFCYLPCLLSYDDRSYILFCRLYLILSMITKTLSELTESFCFLQVYYKLSLS